MVAEPEVRPLWVGAPTAACGSSPRQDVEQPYVAGVGEQSGNLVAVAHLGSRLREGVLDPGPQEVPAHSQPEVALGGDCSCGCASACSRAKGPVPIQQLLVGDRHRD